MIVLQIIFEAFVLYQITTIIVDSTLFDIIKSPFRNNKYLGLLSHLLDCFLCTSVWVGFVLSEFLLNFSEYLGYYEYSTIWNSMFFSAIAWFINKFDKS